MIFQARTRFCLWVGNPFIQTVSEFVLGGVFIFAGLTKILNHAGFINAVESFKLLPTVLVEVIAMVLPWIEFIAGICLVMKIYRRISAAILSLLLVIFIGAILINLVRGINISCGCIMQSFEEKNFSSVDSIVLLIRDMVLLIPGIIICFFHNQVGEGCVVKASGRGNIYASGVAGSGEGETAG